MRAVRWVNFQSKSFRQKQGRCYRAQTLPSLVNWRPGSRWILGKIVLSHHSFYFLCVLLTYPSNILFSAIQNIEFYFCTTHLLLYVLFLCMHLTFIFSPDCVSLVDCYCTELIRLNCRKQRHWLFFTINKKGCSVHRSKHLSVMYALLNIATKWPQGQTVKPVVQSLKRRLAFSFFFLSSLNIQMCKWVIHTGVHTD